MQQVDDTVNYAAGEDCLQIRELVGLDSRFGGRDPVFATPPLSINFHPPPPR